MSYKGYTDDLYDNVVLLIHGDSQNGDAGQIIDSSKYNVNLTNTGPVTANTGTLNYGYSTLYFNGSSYLNTPPSSNYSFDAGNFTIEMWVNLTSFTVNTRFYYNAPYGTTWGANQFTLGTTATNFYFTHNTLGTITGSTALSTSTWYHVALVRNGTILSMYVNGTSEGTPLSVGTSTIDGGGAVVAVFGALGAGNTLTGYLDDIRITKGVARYTSTFTVPNRAFLPAVYEYPPVGISDPNWNNTTLLLHGDDLTDSSPVNATMTNSATPVTVNNSTYKYGSGSMSFGGSSYLQTPSNSNYTFGTNNFTIEFWVYCTTTGTCTILSNSLGTDAAGRWLIYQQGVTGSTVNIIFNIYGSSSYPQCTINTNTWVHISMVRNTGGAFTMYANGVAGINSYTNAASTDGGTNNLMAIGNGTTGSTPFSGYLDDIRITKGVARYTANFTPPTAGLNSFERMGSNAYTFYYQSYGNGTYTASASSTSGSVNYEYYAFNKVNPTDASAQYSWRNNSTTAYDATSGLYSANAYSTLVSGTVYNGEWLQIQCPTRIYATGYTLTSPNHTANTYLGTPGSWVVAGSNDGANWSLLDARNYQIFSSNNVTATYSIPYMSNAYSFYRMVVTKSQTPTGGNYLYVGEWKLFADTSQKPPVGLEYPPSALSGTGLTNTTTIYGQPYGNGTYVASASSGNDTTNYPPSTSFNKVFPNGDQWLTAASKYTASTGAYAGATTTVGISGEWLQIQLPSPIVLNSYTLYAFYSTAGGTNYLRTPYTWTILGSNDGVTWATVDTKSSQSFTSYGQSRTLTVSSGTSAYVIFRMVIQATQPSTPDGFAEVGEWRIYGTPVTSPSYMYMDGAGTDSMNFIQCDGSGNLYMGCNAGIAPVNVYNVGGAPSPYVTQVEPYFNNTTLLLHADDFTDSSQYNATLTNTGSVTVNTTIYKYGTGSFQFSGGTSGNYLTTPSSVTYSLGSSDFTIEFWVYSANLTNLSSNYPGLMGSVPNIAYGNGYWLIVYYNTTNRIAFLATSTGSYASVPNAITVNTWSHLAFVRKGTSMIAFIDGVGTTYPTYFSSVSDIDGSASRLVNIGGSGVNPGTPDPRMTGYIDDVRITKGLARYTSNFTPPAAAFADNTAQDVLLLHGDTNFNDSSPVGATLTNTGTVTVNNSIYKYGGGSMQFSGSNYLTTPSSSNYTFGTGDFTIEFWTYFSSSSNPRFIGNSTGTWTTGVWLMYLNTTTNTISFTVNGNSPDATNPSVISTNTWYHIAMVKKSSVSTIYINGVAGTSVNTAFSIDSGTNNIINIGSGGVTSDPKFTGFLDEVRITKGLARYTSNFTPPTAAFLDQKTPTYGIVKYNPSGSALWNSTYRYQNGFVTGLSVTPLGSVYSLSNANSSTYTFNNANGTTGGTLAVTSTNSKAVVVKYDTTGTYKWSAYLSPSSSVSSSGVGSDSSENVYLCGWYQGTITAINSDTSTSSVTLSAPSSDGAYMVKYNGNGFAQWAVRVDGTGSDSASYAVSDGSNVFLSTTSVTATATVYNSDGTSFGTGIPSSTNTRALIKYNATGFAQWVAYITNDNGSLGSASASVQIDSTGNLYLWGQKASGIASIYNAGGVSSGVGIPATTGVGAYIVKYNSSGVYQWYLYIDGAGTDIVTGVDTDIYGTVYICGQSSTGGGTIYTSSGTTGFVMPTTTVPQMFLVNVTTSGLLVNFKYGTTGGSALTSGYLSVDQNTLKVYATGSTTGGTLTLNNFSNVTVTTTPSMVGQGVFTVVDQPGLEWPPAALLSNATVLNAQTYGNGQYNATASTSNTSSYYASYAFDKLQVINDGWQSSTTAYNTSTGVYAGAVSTTVSGTAYTGEWVQVQFPVPVNLVSYILTSYNSGAGTYYLCTPNSWVLAGSNDGTIWTLLDTQAGQNYNAYAQTRVFVVNQSTGYLYYRLIARTIQASSGYGACMIGELRYYGYPYYAQVPGDPFFNNTVLLLHSDDFTDSSPVNATLTNSATPVTVDATAYKYGSGSFYFSGTSTGNYLTTPSNSNYTFGIGDFTIECWIYPQSTTSMDVMGNSTGGYTTGNWSMYTQLSTSKIIFTQSGRSDVYYTGVSATNTWYHVAVVRYGSNCTMYVNGVAGANIITNMTWSFDTGTNNILNIGAGVYTGNGRFQGYIDEIRITKGVARYTSNFVVPAFPFPDRNGTLVEYPPAAMSSTTTTLSGQSYGNGTYVASASSTLAGFPITGIFDKTNTSTTSTGWSTSTTGYSTGNISPAPYTAGTYSTTVSGTSYGGEWIQIQLPSQIILASYKWESGVGIGVDRYYQCPSSWIVAGSNDGSAWTLVDSRTGILNWGASLPNQTFTVTNSSQYLYYRVIVTAIQGSSSTNYGHYSSCGEWRLYGRGGV